MRQDGSAFWANVIITALRDETGALRGFANVTRDRTRRVETEEALRRSEERFRLMVDTVLDYAILMLDTAGRVTSWNAGAQRIKGYSTEEIVGRHYSVFYLTEDIERGKAQDALDVAAAEGRYADEGWRKRKDGSRFWAYVVITAVRDPAGRLIGYSKVTRDLSELLPDLVPALKARVHAPQGVVAYHPPCTLQHGQKLRGGVETHLRALGFDVRVALNESHLCCGSAGTYSVLQPELAYPLRDRKLGHLEQLQPSVIASANIGCITHLQSGSQKTPVRHWVELLDAALAAA